MIARQLHDDSCVHLGVFHDDGSGKKLVGYVWYVHREESSYPLLGIGVVDTFQNANIGTELMQQVEHVARDRGEQGIELTCYLENCRAIRVYSKAGYRLIGKNGDGTQFRMRRHFVDDDAPFLIQGVYASSIPWNIPPLTTDS